MSVVGFAVLAALAVFFVIAPRLGMGRVKAVDASKAQKELLLERLQEIEDDGAEQTSQLATDIAADLSSNRVNEPSITLGASRAALVALSILIPAMAYGVL